MNLALRLTAVNICMSAGTGAASVSRNRSCFRQSHEPCCVSFCHITLTTHMTVMRVHMHIDHCTCVLCDDHAGVLTTPILRWSCWMSRQTRCALPASTLKVSAGSLICPPHSECAFQITMCRCCVHVVTVHSCMCACHSLVCNHSSKLPGSPCIVHFEFSFSTLLPLIDCSGHLTPLFVQQLQLLFLIKCRPWQRAWVLRAPGQDCAGL
jgi:hypothetical protein